MATSRIQKVVKKIISVLGGVSDISSVVSDRIYGAHISTIQDYKLPAISIHVLPGGPRPEDEGGMELIELQIDLWMSRAGKNAYTWDDVMELWADVLDTLHGNGYEEGGVRLMKIVNVSHGPQMYEEAEGVLHFPTRWRIRAI